VDHAQSSPQNAGGQLPTALIDGYIDLVGSQSVLCHQYDVGLRCDWTSKKKRSNFGQPRR
jgi:hypothetical protein